MGRPRQDNRFKVGEYWLCNSRNGVLKSAGKTLWRIEEKQSQGRRILRLVAELEKSTWGMMIKERVLSCQGLNDNKVWQHVPDPKTLLILFGKTDES